MWENWLQKMWIWTLEIPKGLKKESMCWQSESILQTFCLLILQRNSNRRCEKPLQWGWERSFLDKSSMKTRFVISDVSCCWGIASWIIPDGAGSKLWIFSKCWITFNSLVIKYRDACGNISRWALIDDGGDCIDFNLRFNSTASF